MPTALGALPTQTVPPVADLQRSWGWSNAGIELNGRAGGSLLETGIGGYFQTSFTPTYNGYYVAEGQGLFLSGSPGAWVHVMLGLRISPADLDGIVLGNYIAIAIEDVIGWRSMSASCIFRVAAGQAYTVSLTYEGGSDGWSRVLHQSYQWTRLNGVLVAESTT